MRRYPSGAVKPSLADMAMRAAMARLLFVAALATGFFTPSLSHDDDGRGQHSAPPYTYGVNPTGSYTFVNPSGPPADVASPPTIINLAALGLRPGQAISLTASGTFLACGSTTICPPMSPPPLCALFSSSAVILPPTSVNRVPGAIAPNFSQVTPCFTDPTLEGGIPTDIPQDFVASSVVATIPPGAGYLIVAVNDTYYADNLGNPQITLAPASTTAPETAYTYQIVTYPNPPVPSNPCIGAYGINDLGQVVGYECSSGVGIPFMWQNGLFTSLPPNPLAGPLGTFPLSISNAGQIVGEFFDAAGSLHGFLYTPNTTPAYLQIDHPPPVLAKDAPYGTQLFGLSLTAGSQHGIVGSTVLYPYAPADYFGTIYDAGRQVIDTESPPHVWQDFDGSTDPVNGAYNGVVPSGTPNFPRGINAAGVIAGRRGAPYNDSYIYIGGTAIPGVCPLQTSPTPPTNCTPRFTTFAYSVDGMPYPTHATGINDNGDVVGWLEDVADLYSGQSFVRSGVTGTLELLNVIDPDTGAQYISTATGINNRGALVGDAYTVATWNNSPNGDDGAAFFVATPGVASKGVPANNCNANKGGCQLSPGLNFSVQGAANLPGTITEQVCYVNPDPRINPVTGVCSGKPLPLAKVCPGFPDVVIPGSLCGGAGPTNSAFLVALNTANGIDALSNILVNAELSAQQALGGSGPACPKTVGAWTTNPDSSVEGTVPEGNVLHEQTTYCGSSGIVSRGLSLYGVGLTLNLAALPGDSAREKLRRFTEEKYENLFKTIAEGNMDARERTRVNACVAHSLEHFASGGEKCAARKIVECDAEVAAHVDDFGSSSADPNVYGDIRGRLANLYLTIDSRILGDPPAASWPVPLSSAPSCDSDEGEDE